MAKNETHNPPLVCEPIATFLRKLTEKGFIVLDNGAYSAEPTTKPDPDSLYFRLQSPKQLATFNLTDDACYLATFGLNTYMCECHYHLVKLVSPA